MKNISEFIKVYDDWIDEENRKKKLKELKTIEWQKHTFSVYGSQETVSLSGDKELDYGYCDEADDAYIMQRIWDGFYRYLNDMQIKEYDHWHGYSPVKYNRYQKGQTMHPHVDHIQTIFDGNRKGIPTMTAVGLLNDTFKGGDFIINDEVIELKAGSLLIFPSNYLYPHTVTPVTSGVRYAFVSWAW